VNAVADVLRQFFRQLEAPLIPVAIQMTYSGSVSNTPLYHQYLLNVKLVAGMASTTQKVDEYRRLFSSLQLTDTVYYCTLKKLMGHLQQITSHSDKNLASVTNICKVFGLTLFTVNNVRGN